MTINLLDTITYFRDLDHQVAAFRWLDKNLTKEQKAEFARLYRNEKNTTAPSNIEITNTWDGILKGAAHAGAKFPEVVAAQWALESGYGKHTSGKNNFFGLKGTGTSTTTKEFVNGKWITITASFLNFPNIQACVQYLVDRWYKDYEVFKGVNRATTRNECAQLLAKEGYATDPDYAGKLIRIMDKERVEAPQRPIISNEKILSVPYFYQLDNLSNTGYRECFSSSCAMIAAYYGRVKTDDEYNEIRKKYGDTTDSSVQLKTLRALGLTARFITNGNTTLIENEIRRDRPIAVGWLHQGMVSNPSGGGHWSVIKGFTPTHFVHNDPQGEANITSGGYVSTSPKAGQGIRYPKTNWLKRWEINSPNTGWAILVNK